MKSALKLLICLALLCGFTFARPDTRSYYSEVDTPAIWINPKNIAVYIYPDATKEYILTRSVKAWDDALSSDLNFRYVNSPDKADITIKYVNKLDGNRAGTTHVKHMQIQGKVYLGRADILIGKAAPSGYIHKDTDLNKITLHELGHAIGILGHSDNINDVMYPSTVSTRMSTLSSKDIETVRRIYGF